METNIKEDLTEFLHNSIENHFGYQYGYWNENNIKEVAKDILDNFSIYGKDFGIDGLNTEKNNKTFDWPENIINDLYLEYYSVDHAIGMIPGLTYCINNYLNVKERFVITEYYQKGRKYKDIAEDLGLSKQGISCIRKNALRKLRFNRTRREIIVLGYDRAEKLRRDCYQAETEYVEKREEMLKRTRSIERIKDKLDEEEKETLEKIKDYHDSIDSLELSTRPYNCLWRKGIRYINELLQLTPDEVMHIRNMGLRSYQEIVDALSKRGLRLKEE